MSIFSVCGLTPWVTALAGALTADTDRKASVVLKSATLPIESAVNTNSEALAVLAELKPVSAPE